MKTLLVAALLGLAAPLPRATAAPAERWSFPLESIKTVPAEAHIQMPRGAKTLQCGLGPVDARGKDILLHLYSLAVGMSHCRIDLYERSPHATKSSWRRVNRVAVEQDALHPARPRINTDYDSGAWMTWLDRRRHRVLIVPLYLGGDEGEIRLLTFPSGYTRPPAVQAFQFNQGGGYYSYTTNRLSLDKIDENGLTQATCTFEHIDGPEVIERTEEVYTWNGHRFVQQPDK